MHVLRRSTTFQTWLDRLADDDAAARITIRPARLERGLFGDVRPVGSGLSELRLDFGPGYRVSFVQRGRVVIVVLGGGTKRTQSRDIAAAKALAADTEDGSW